jgi:hypothetical protein
VRFVRAEQERWSGARRRFAELRARLAALLGEISAADAQG